jgi:uncharacterized protein (DUF885 family)
MGRVVFAAAAGALRACRQRCAAAQGPERFSGPSSQSLLQIFDEYWEWKIAHRPELATQAGRREHNARWTDRSKARRDKDLYDLREWLQRGDVVLARHADAVDAAERVPPRIRHPRSDRVEPYLAPSRWSRRPTGAQPRVHDHRSDAARTVLDYENIVARLRRCRRTSTRRSARSRSTSTPG